MADCTFCLLNIFEEQCKIRKSCKTSLYIILKALSNMTKIRQTLFSPCLVYSEVFSGAYVHDRVAAIECCKPEKASTLQPGKFVVMNNVECEF